MRAAKLRQVLIMDNGLKSFIVLAVIGGMLVMLSIFSILGKA
jgi:hypothetical protein